MMTTATKTPAKNKPLRRLSGVRNPHARPRSGKPLPAGPALVDVGGRVAGVPGLSFYAGEFYEVASHVIWICEYGVRFLTGTAGRQLHLRQIAAATRDEALRKLREQLIGFGLAEILLVRVIEPPTRADLLRLEAANEQLRRDIDAAWSAGWFRGEIRMDMDKRRTTENTEVSEHGGPNE